MENSEIKIVFIGTPEFGAIVLEGLINGGYKPILIVTAPDKPVGRKQIITPPPAKISAQKYNIPIIQPEKLSIIIDQLLSSKPDLIIVAGYREILPKEILEIPKYGCLNVHPSLLPKYRGPSPIQYAILNGDEETGVTIIKMVEKVDIGGIIGSIKYEVGSRKITSKELEKELAELGAKLLMETIPKWVKGKIKPQPQDESRAIYTKVLKREDGKIDWKKSAEEIERQIRAFDPWPGSFTFFNSKNLKILKAGVLRQTEAGPFGLPGKTFLAPNGKIAVQAGKDYLIIEELQPEGKRKMTAEEFLRGHQDFIGVILK